MTLLLRHIFSLVIFLQPPLCSSWIILPLDSALVTTASRCKQRLAESRGLAATLDPTVGHGPFVSEDEGGDNEDKKQTHRLRFGGVGRLYSESEATVDNLLKRLQAATVVVVGLGGVGSWAAEALCRSGIGHLVLIDLDDICISNTNRQLHATASTVGALKIDEMKRRLTEIAPDCQVDLIHDFVAPDNVHEILKRFNKDKTVVLDAIDGGATKAALLSACTDLGMPVVTCGGAAGKTSATQTVCQDLTVVQGDKLLANCRKQMRQHYGFTQGAPAHSQQKVKKWNIEAVYSTQAPKTLSVVDSDTSSFRRCDGALGTACFVTGTFGFVAAGCIVDKIAANRLKAPRR